MSAYDNDPRVAWDAARDEYRIGDTIIRRRDRFSWGIYQAGMPHPHVAGFQTADEAIRSRIGDPR